MIQGFKAFILRGNVIDLAVAVVIGAAFTGIVNAIVAGLINPLIALVFQADSLDRRRHRRPERPRRHDGLRDRAHPRRDHQLHRGRGRRLLRVRAPDEPPQGAAGGAQGHRAARGGAAADRDRTPRADPRPAREAVADAARLSTHQCGGTSRRMRSSFGPFSASGCRVRPAPRVLRRRARVRRSCPAPASASRGDCRARARRADGHSRTSNGCVSVSAVAASGATPSSAAIRDATPAGSL